MLDRDCDIAQHSLGAVVTLGSVIRDLPLRISWPQPLNPFNRSRETARGARATRAPPADNPPARGARLLGDEELYRFRVVEFGERVIQRSRLPTPRSSVVCVGWGTRRHSAGASLRPRRDCGEGSSRGRFTAVADAPTGLDAAIDADE